jgi:hypothetical protein
MQTFIPVSLTRVPDPRLDMQVFGPPVFGIQCTDQFSGSESGSVWSTSLSLPDPDSFVRAQSTYLYRVPQCMSPRRNWDSPTPYLATASVPLPRNRGGAHSPVAEGSGESQYRRLETSLALYYLLCGQRHGSGSASLHRENTVRKTLIFLMFCYFLLTFYLWKDVIVPVPKSIKQKIKPFCDKVVTDLFRPADGWGPSPRLTLKPRQFPRQPPRLKR